MSNVDAAHCFESRIVIENVHWETYEALAQQRRGSVPRMTFDNGLLELMSPKRQHENIGRFHRFTY